ncbi:hypothetical protein Q5P01_016633 [Channa striata]|uniref:Trichohyalin-plectin-homology domain-containing protein n=1 Tax=Channa striata TaxID=64152 RepID=A0AA88SAN6_CHASR|nr:hypothetical protein Q5P01_016633 [Channa striata]
MAQIQEVTLSKAEWDRIHSVLNKPKPKVYTRQEVVDRNAQLQFSRAKLKLNKALMGKMHLETKRRREAHEDYLNKSAAEEAETKKQERQNMIERAKYEALQQDHRVRQINRMLQMTSVQDENEALIQLKEEKQKVADEQKRQYEEEMRSVQAEAVKQKQEKANVKQLSSQALATYWVEQMREKQQQREKQMRQEKEEGERNRRLAELQVQEELRNQAQLQAESKKKCSKNLQEHISCGKLQREMEAHKLDVEEEKRKRVELYLEDKIQQKRKEQAEKFRNHQLLIENVSDKLAVKLKEQATATARKEEQTLFQTLVKHDAALAKQQKDKEEKRAAMVKSIAAHRERTIQEKILKEQAEQKSSLDWFEAQKESNRLFHQKQIQKAQKAREDRIKCREDNSILMAEKIKRDKHEAAVRSSDQPAEMEDEILSYIERELCKASDSQRKVPLHLPARTGGHGYLISALKVFSWILFI